MSAALPTVRNGRRVVLKRVDDDCLLDGQLHPSIRLRLERVRELPLRSVANLHGVERIDDGGATGGAACLVWEYVSGTPLAELQAPQQVDWLRVAREVVLAVEELHLAGIVHGAIHPRNVLLCADGQVRLTHVSPLLYSEPDQDAQDVAIMLADLVIAADDESELAEVLAAAAAEPTITLAALDARLAMIDVEPKPEPAVEPTPTLRARSIVWAIIVTLAGIALAAGIAWRVTQTQDRPIAPPAETGQG